MGDVWSFQIGSDKRTPAMLKDDVRPVVGMHTGERTWAKADVVLSATNGGSAEVLNGLSRFGCGPLTDCGRARVVIWGGITKGAEVLGDGWIMAVD